jgi:murein DD-endopeptidase MepM/ murein hydrolase activator NlpD
MLRDTYSDARGSGRRHDAIDIMAARGTPVLAAASSTVVKRDHGARGGTALYALGDDGRTVYYYAHLDGYADGITPGTKLNAGDVIGYVGNTGNAGPNNYHLHFEITTTKDPRRYWGGASTNPYPILRNGVTIRQ